MFIGFSKKQLQKEFDYFMEEYCPLCGSIIKNNKKEKIKTCTNRNCVWEWEFE
jgi:translation initiation factor 2 beta subunit (eIF-2beta)/eIF-5